MIVQNKRKISRILSLLVVITGITVMLGWIFDITALKSISSAWVSMKFDSAIAFVLSGVIMYFIAKALDGYIDVAQVVLFVASFIVILLMGTLFVAAISGLHTGAEGLFVKEANISAKTVVPGLPSIPTMVNFLFIAAAGILTMLDAGKARLKLKVIGLLVVVTGALAVVGYAINAPLFYYYVKGVNSAMACHTAGLFVLIGIGLLCL